METAQYAVGATILIPTEEEGYDAGARTRAPFLGSHQLAADIFSEDIHADP